MTPAELASPRIAIPARIFEPATGYADPRMRGAQMVFNAVVDLIRESGAQPVIVEQGPEASIERTLRSCHGFVVPGGGDVDPELYGAPSGHPTLFGVNREQDILDSQVIRFALNSRRPLLGICRGMQLLNVVSGGTLEIDLGLSSVKHALPPLTGLEMSVHEVKFVEKTRCASVFGSVPSIEVASSHHQAVDVLGEGLRAAAYAADGIVEAIESVDDARWTLGIQWHPEADIPQARLRLPVFTALKDAAQLIVIPAPPAPEPVRKRVELQDA